MTKLIHVLVYTALSANYFGAALGFDKSMVSITTAALYMLLASDEWRKR